jgi:cell filamentation protein, protein adenylyltransferase
MDTNKFQDPTTGNLVKILPEYDDLAFVSAPLPPKWEFPGELWQKVANAKQLLGELDGIGRTLPNPELLLRPLRNREALRSSSLEGTYATPAELLLFEMRPATASKSEQVESWREVSNYGRALTEGYAYLTDHPFTLDFIKQLHHWLLSHVRGSAKSPGQFRTGQVQIGSTGRFIPPPVEYLDSCLRSLEPFLNSSKRCLYDPLVYCYLVHYQFETIHPFKDGNGRVGRLLLALMTWRECNLSAPWLYMSAFFERHKDEYVEGLFNVSARGNWKEWIDFCLTGTIEQARDAIRRCDLLGKLKDEMHSKITTGSGRLHRLVDGLFQEPLTTIPIVRDEMSVSYPTAKADIVYLIKIGILARLNNPTKPMVFYAPRIFSIAYSDLDEES